MAAAAASPLVGRATRGREGGASRVVNTEHASSKYYRQVLELVLSRNRWHEERGRPSRAASVIWWDEPIRRPHFLALPPQAQVNRFYAMVRICRKVCLARLLDLARRLYPSKYLRLAPETWWVGQKSWAAQLRAHRHHCEIRDRDECNSSDLTIESYDANASAVGTRAPSIAVAAETGECANIDAFIIKPDNGCQGTGIKLVRSHSELCAFLKSKEGMSLAFPGIAALPPPPAFPAPSFASVAPLPLRCCTTTLSLGEAYRELTHRLALCIMLPQPQRVR
eukprot:scaffold61457_cov33-Tisochrysis_lutea.AAC.1